MPDHHPLSFDDDDYRPFRRGEMKPFKKRLAEHAQEKGYTEEAKRHWRAGNQGTRRRKEDKTDE